jgi:hypothetical protein
MGEIIDEKRLPSKVVYKIKLSLTENIQLKNHMKNIHLFCSDTIFSRSKIVQRGNNGGAKYFFVPFTLKSRKKVKLSNITYQKINVGGRLGYIISASKEKF